MSVTRRTVLSSLCLGGVSLALASRARAIGPGSKFQFGQLSLGDAPNPRPEALRRLAWELDKRTSIEVELDPRPVSLSSPDLHLAPFVVLSGAREFNIPKPAEIEALRRYLTYGGFLFIDSAEGLTDGAFDQSVRKLIEAVYPPPSERLELIAADHVIYKSFYLVDRPAGRVAVTPVMEAVRRDDRLVIVYSQNDLAGAWSRDSFGNFEFQCVPGGERQREMATRLGINLVMYALCLDYKSDQVHVPFIMRRRRWRPDDEAAPEPPPGTTKP